MNSMKIVIIGNGPAAIKALEAIDLHVDVSSSRRPEVTVISSEKAKAYAPMFLIKYITGQLTEGQLLLTPEDQGYSFPARKIFGTRVVELKEENRKIVLEDGREIGFDKLLIASGSSPITPPISSLTRKGVFFLGRLGDAKNISRAVKQASDVIIIGAGAMGMEAAVAFDHRGKKIKVVELAGHILPQTLGPNPAEYARGKLEAQGIEFRLGEAV
ncbi:MAG: FAD-dependent oxidoreductase, partial [Desulfatiglandales bacterium]|nr:FAD-dependent oxidoreductase [Desulfatiglandales bacterium]